MTDLLKEIRDVSPNSLILTCIDNSTTDTKQTEYGEFLKGSPISYQQQLHTNFIINIYNAPHFPYLPIHNAMSPHYHVALTEEKLVCHTSIEVSMTTAHKLEEETRLQSSDPKWHKLRYHRVTASKAGEICKRRRGKVENSTFIIC